MREKKDQLIAICINCEVVEGFKGKGGRREGVEQEGYQWQLHRYLCGAAHLTQNTSRVKS
jgi:hypothetical protein